MLLLALAAWPARASEPAQTQWKLNTFTWVKRVPAEAGAPASAQPANLTPEALQAALGPVLVSLEGEDTALFAKDELKPLAKALSEALALAKPGEDLVVLSTFKRSSSFLEMAMGLTARLFVRDGTLNLIVHDARLDFMSRYSVDRTLPTFTYGSRSTASGVTLQAPGAIRLRADWLALPLSTIPAPAPVVVPVTAALPAKATPTTPASPAITPDPSAGPRDAAFYEAQTQRLKALKKMRDEDVLTEAEYQQKREAILKTL
jgi:hypothetical protein